MKRFWDGEFLGLTFEGMDVNRNGISCCIDRGASIYILGGGEKSTISASDMLKNRGFNVERSVVINNEEDLISQLDLIDGDAVLILSDKQIWRQFGDRIRLFGKPVLLYDHVRMFFNIFLPQLRKVYDLLDEEFSKDTYTAVLLHRFKIFPRHVLYKYITDKQYFCIPEQMVLNSNEVFVDCGAYVGDTVEKFIWARDGIFRKIYAFEPYEKVHNALDSRVQRLKTEWALDNDSINVIRAGCGDSTCKMAIQTNGSDMASVLKTVTDDNNVIDVYALDDYFEHEKVTFIKADIEGMEMSMLKGAQSIIKRDRPNLAICIYHKLTDYYEIPLFIHELVPEYKMRIRHHSSFMEETVLYCYIENGL